MRGWDIGVGFFWGGGRRRGGVGHCGGVGRGRAGLGGARGL